MVLDFIGSNEGVTEQGDKAKQSIFLISAFLLLFFNTSIIHAFSASLSWSPNTEGSLLGYELYYGSAPGSYDVSIDIGNQTSYTLEGLSAGTYYFSITAYTATNESDFSAEVSKTFLDIDTTPIHAFSTTLSWNANSDGSLLGYKLYSGNAPGSYDFSIDMGNQTSYTLEGLSAGTYYFAITAYTATNESDFSAEVSKIFLDMSLNKSQLLESAYGSNRD